MSIKNGGLSIQAACVASVVGLMFLGTVAEAAGAKSGGKNAKQQRSAEDEIDAALLAEESTPRKPALASADDTAIGDAAEATVPSDTPVVSAEPLPDIGEDQLAVFKLQRGFYVATDFGAFTTLTGERGYSNIEPFMAIKVGFDIGNYVSLQASVASGFSSGNAGSPTDRPEVNRAAVPDYGLLHMGAEVVGAWRPTDRFAVEPKLGGGVSRVTPQIADPKDATKKLGPMLPHVMAGVEFKYLTLLTDFTVGGGVNLYLLDPGNATHANMLSLAEMLTVRYTF